VERVANPAHLAPDLALGMDLVLEPGRQVASLARVVHLDLEAGQLVATVVGPHLESPARADPVVDGNQAAAVRVERAAPAVDGNQAAAARVERADPAVDGDQVAAVRVERAAPAVDGNQAAAVRAERADPAVAAVAGPRRESLGRVARLEEDRAAVASQARVAHLEEEDGLLRKKKDGKVRDGKVLPPVASQARAVRQDLEAGQLVATVVGPHLESPARADPVVDGNQAAAVRVERAAPAVDGNQAAAVRAERADPAVAAVAGPRRESLGRVARLEEDRAAVASQARAAHLEEDGVRAAVASQVRVAHLDPEAGHQVASLARVALLDLEAGQLAAAAVAGRAVASLARAAHLVGNVALTSNGSVVVG